MNKKTAIWIVVLSAVIICAIIVVWIRNYTPGYPEGVLYDRVTYTIDPQTVLASIDQGNTDVFLPAPPDPGGPWPTLWPPGSFTWNQKDYFKTTDALHQFVWKESLKDWNLIRASFDIDQCKDVFSGIDNADFSFYQRRTGLNDVHGFWIRPLYGVVHAGNEYSHDSGWTAKWKSIDLNKTKINSVDVALQVAEENGGKEARSVAKNECHISLLLAPDRFEYDILSHPFTHYGWGWSVIYWPNESNADPIFEITIDPYTGKYEIRPSQ